MKRFVLFIAILCIGYNAFAQDVKIITTDDYRQVGVEFKRCFEEDGKVYLDLLLVNNSGEDFNCQIFDRSMAYDDEGNAYSAKGESEMRLGKFTMGGVSKEIGSFYTTVNLPVAVSLKARVEILGIDKFASSFQLVKLAFKGGDIEIRNVPITRE